jgi:hypothetical protein
VTVAQMHDRDVKNKTPAQEEGTAGPVRSGS